MKLKLEPLKTANLTNMEVGQLTVRHLSDLDSIDPASKTDAPFNAYTNDLGLQMGEYQKGLAQVQKNEETEKIVVADATRDKAASAIGAALKLHAMSDVPEEVETQPQFGYFIWHLQKSDDLKLRSRNACHRQVGKRTYKSNIQR